MLLQLIGCLSFNILYTYVVYAIPENISELPEVECTDGDVRLIQRERESSGAFQLCRGGVWGTVCFNSLPTPSSANVTCRQLGFGSGE